MATLEAFFPERLTRLWEDQNVPAIVNALNQNRAIAKGFFAWTEQLNPHSETSKLAGRVVALLQFSVDLAEVDLCAERLFGPGHLEWVAGVRRALKSPLFSPAHVTKLGEMLRACLAFQNPLARLEVVVDTLSIQKYRNLFSTHHGWHFLEEAMLKGIPINFEKIIERGWQLDCHAFWTLSRPPNDLRLREKFEEISLVQCAAHYNNTAALRPLIDRCPLENQEALWPLETESVMDFAGGEEAALMILQKCPHSHVIPYLKILLQKRQRDSERWKNVLDQPHIISAAFNHFQPGEKIEEALALILWCLEQEDIQSAQTILKSVLTPEELDSHASDLLEGNHPLKLFLLWEYPDFVDNYLNRFNDPSNWETHYRLAFLPYLSPNLIRHTIQNLSRRANRDLVDAEVLVDGELMPLGLALPMVQAAWLVNINDTDRECVFLRWVQLFLRRISPECLGTAASNLEIQPILLNYLPFLNPLQINVVVPQIPKAKFVSWMKQQPQAAQALFLKSATTDQKVAFLGNVSLTDPALKNWQAKIEGFKSAWVRSDKSEGSELIKCSLLSFESHMLPAKKALESLFNALILHESLPDLLEKIQIKKAKSLTTLTWIERKLVNSVLITDLRSFQPKRKREVPNDLIDLISFEIMANPVILPGTGQTVEFTSLLRREEDGWFQNPYNGIYYEPRGFVEDSAIKAKIRDWNSSEGLLTTKSPRPVSQTNTD